MRHSCTTRNLDCVQAQKEAEKVKPAGFGSERVLKKSQHVFKVPCMLKLLQVLYTPLTLCMLSVHTRTPSKV